MNRLVHLRSPAGARCAVLGGILGVADDVAVLHRALADESWSAILLGIPFEDLDAVRATAGHEQEKEFRRDATDEIYFQQLQRFAPPVVPPPDLYAAFAHATQRGLPLEAIDLGDEAHADSWTRNVGMLELLRSNRAQKKLPARAFVSTNPEMFALEWDGVLNATRGMKKVQAEREAWMAQRIDDLSRSHPALFALVPLARLDGLRATLEARFGFTSA